MASGIYSSDCDSDFPAEAAAFANLRGAGIAPVAASGNDGSDAGVGDPSCQSTAVTVASSSQGDQQKQIECVSDFSNLNSLVELMAPGEDIRGAVPKGAPCDRNADLYCTEDGTSLAAPHVAGAVAVLREAKPSATIDAIVHARECSGKIVELSENPANPDNPYRLAKPRIDLLGAYNFLNKVRKRSWNFETSAQDFDWTPFNQQWLVSQGQYHPLPPYPPPYYLYAAVSSTANCDLSLDVTVNMAREYPKGRGDGSTTGVILKSQLNYANRHESGFYFGYAYNSKNPKAQRGFAFIYEIIDSNFYLLCSKSKNAPVNFNKLNTIRAISASPRRSSISMASSYARRRATPTTGRAPSRSPATSPTIPAASSTSIPWR